MLCQFHPSEKWEPTDQRTRHEDHPFVFVIAFFTSLASFAGPVLAQDTQGIQKRTIRFEFSWKGSRPIALAANKSEEIVSRAEGRSRSGVPGATNSASTCSTCRLCSENQEMMVRTSAQVADYAFRPASSGNRPYS